MLLIYLSALETEEERVKMTDIYENHKYAMLRYALKITKNKQIAEDAVHNAFLSIIKHKDKYFSLSSMDMRVLLVIITKNKCIDLIKKVDVFADDPIDEMENVLPSRDKPIEEQLILNEEYESLKKHVAALDEKSRLVLEMKYLLEMSYKEIGEQLGITPKHVDTRIQRAKEKVRRIIAQGGGSSGSQQNK